MAIPKAFGWVRAMPNLGSEHQTPASLMIDTHYCQLQLVERWTWERYARLCRFLKMTPWEVASLALMSHHKIDVYRRTGRLSGPNMRAIALVLTLVEHHTMNRWATDTIADPFPTLPSTNGSTQSSETPETAERRSRCSNEPP